jgi:tetratricopeptide (TPR) repeat protein
MTGRRSIVVVLIACGLADRVWAGIPVTSELTQGVQSYQEHRWTEAMGHFLQVLSQDPSNKEAHTYMDLLAQELDQQKRRTTHDDRLMILASATQVLDANRMNSSPVQQALRDTTAVEADHERQQRHAQCTMAQTEALLGHLPAANDLVLQVIAQSPNDGEAQRLLSDLQSQIRQTLDTRKDLSVSERRTLEGFYAYGQADYASAAAAWSQARSALLQSSPGPEASHQIALLHFEAYEKIARTHVDEELEAARIKVLFGDGVAAFEKQDFDKALGAFRQVALASPTFPQLGQYLVQSEAAVERKRTSDLTDDKRNQTAQSFAKGLASLENEDYAQAKAFFEEVLAMDPAHPQAKLYIQQIDTQKNRQVDPAAAQQHYEAGVIAYVSGESEQAVREWHIAHRLDPDNPKIAEAVHKVERELVLSKELP